MDTPLKPYFTPDHLKAMLARNIDEALLDKRLSDDEVAWLRLLFEPSQSTEDAPRLDRLELTEGTGSSEFVAAVLISHSTTANARVYLHTMLYGIEGFDSRTALLEKLQQRFTSAGDALPDFEYERLEGGFESWMSLIVDDRISALDKLFSQLETLPTLRQAMGRLLADSLAAAMPGVTYDPEAIYLQVTQTQTDPANAAVPTVSTVAVVTLLDAALKEYAGGGLSTGQHRVVLDAQGWMVQASTAHIYLQTLSGLVAGLTGSLEKQLLEYWRSPSQGSLLTHRASAALALAESFRQALLDTKANGKISPLHFNRLCALLPGGAADSPPSGLRISKLAVTFGDGEPLKVVGMLNIELDGPDSSGLWHFCAESGLRHFDNHEALTRHFSTGEGRAQLFNHLSFNDHPYAAWDGPLVLEDEAFEGEVFFSVVESIIALQGRNVAYVIKHGSGDQHAAAALVDDALDVRRLLDCRLLMRNDNDRWRSKARQFVPQPKMVAGATKAVRPSVPGKPATRDALWIAQVVNLEQDLRKLRLAHPRLVGCVHELLNRQLCVFGDARLDASQLTLHLPGQTADAPSESINLTAWLLELISGRRSSELQAGTRLLRPAAHPGLLPVEAALPLALLQRLVKRVHAQFPARYKAKVRQFYHRALRQQDHELDPGRLTCNVRAQQLRIELAMERRRGKLGNEALDMLEQVLNRPVQRLRTALGNAAVQLSKVLLEYDPTKPPVELTNTFVMHQPAHADGQLVFWSAHKGLRIYDSLLQLESQLNRWLRSPTEKGRWQTLLSAEAKAAVNARLERSSAITVQTQVIDGHFIAQLQAAEQLRHYDEIDDALVFATRRRLDSSAFIQVSHDAEISDTNATTLDSFYIGLQSQLFEATLPDWMTGASSADLHVYGRLLVEYCRVMRSGQDFLFDVPLLKTFAREKLLAQLALDFPGVAFAPDSIIVKHFRYITTGTLGSNSPLALPAATQAYSQTLTDFVLNHLAADKGFSLSVSTTDPHQVITGLTPPYLNALARKLDIGTRFLKVLDEKLSKKSPDFERRYSYFRWQMPALILEVAYQQKLDKVISDTAWRYIERIMDMPDGLARQSVDGVPVALRPFALVAAPGRSGDVATGVYLLGPVAPAKGPLVLHAIFHNDFCFREFADDAALLSALRTEPALQNLILQRLSPQARKLYDNGGFNGPHLPTGLVSNLELPISVPAPPTLGTEAVEGNAMLFLFQDTLAVMKRLTSNQTVSAAQSDWASYVYLMTLAGEQILTFLPGKLGMLVGAWQSQSWFQASFAAASTDRWGKALSELTAGLSVLVSLRTAREEELASDVGEDSADVDDTGTADPLDFSWSNSRVSAEVKVRLQSFEVQDVELNKLVADPLLNLYLDNSAQRQYAAVDGKVFEVRLDNGRWRIVRSDAMGPALRLDRHQRWQLDIKLGLFGGGPIYSRLKAAETAAQVDRVFITEAVGMKDIRAQFREKARRLGEAHLEAKRCLETALDNLRFPDPDAKLDPRVEAIIKDFFNVTTVDPTLLASLHRTAKTLFDEILSPSLSPWSSTRYVIGTNKPGYEQTLGLTMRGDTLKRIFLTDRFFATPGFELDPAGEGRVFNIGAHHRAMTLIHEVSHQVLLTEDIAYLESTAPFTDLLRSDTLGMALLKSEINNLQQCSLSHLTPREQLFRVYEHGRWRDLGPMDGAGQANILKIAGTETLDEARDVFFTDAGKRQEIILQNADSVTFLMSKLGRTLFN
jgi:hypothetical protein